MTDPIETAARQLNPTGRYDHAKLVENLRRIAAMTEGEDVQLAAEAAGIALKVSRTWARGLVLKATEQRLDSLLRKAIHMGGVSVFASEGYPRSMAAMPEAHREFAEARGAMLKSLGIESPGDWQEEDPE